MRQYLTFLLTISISAVRIGMGYFNSIAGPTLLYLAHNVNSSVSTVSYMFLGRSIGVMVGAILGGIVKRRHPDFRQMLVLGAATGLLGVASLLIPWITSLWTLVLDVTMGGVMYGYLDAGLQALILQLWGEAGSRPHIQLFHFTYSIGAFIAPIIVRPFLVMADASVPSTSRCSDDVAGTSYFNSTVAVTESGMTTVPNTYFNPVGWAFKISGSWMVLISVGMVALACFDIEGRLSFLSANKGRATEAREEESFRNVMWVFLPVVGYYFCSVATENVFYNFLYSVTLCSDLRFSVTDASFANSLVWVGLGVGRLCGVLASNFLSPRLIIIVSIVGSIIDSFLMMLFGEHHAWLTWAVAFAHGFTPSVMFPSGVSWLSQITNVSGTYMFIFTIGASLGGITMLPLAGYIFDIHPFTVMTQVFVLAVVNAVFFALALYAGKKHRRFLASKSNIKIVQELVEKDTSFDVLEENHFLKR